MRFDDHVHDENYLCNIYEHTFLIYFMYILRGHSLFP
jgi:hypothetical protein